MPIGIGTAVTLAAVSAGTQAASSIYSSHAAASVNHDSIAAQEREAQATRDAQAKAYAQELDFEKQKQADYVKANTPSWEVGQQALGNLYNLANYNGGTAPAMNVPTTASLAAAPPVVSGGGPATGGGVQTAATTTAAPPIAGASGPSTVQAAANRMPMTGVQPINPMMSLSDLMAMRAYRGKNLSLGTAQGPNPTA